MSGQLKVLLAIAVMILGIGAYIVFVEGEVIGVVVHLAAKWQAAIDDTQGNRGAQ